MEAGIWLNKQLSYKEFNEEVVTLSPFVVLRLAKIWIDEHLGVEPITPTKHNNMEAIIWYDNTVSYKESGSTEVITTHKFKDREAALRFLDLIGTDETKN